MNIAALQRRVLSKHGKALAELDDPAAKRRGRRREVIMISGLPWQALPKDLRRETVHSYFVRGDAEPYGGIIARLYVANARRSGKKWRARIDSVKRQRFKCLPGLMIFDTRRLGF